MSNPTSSRGDSPAKTSATPEREPDSPEPEAASGMNTPEPFAMWDQNTSSWKTSQHCLLGGLETYSAPWPTSGTMRNGQCEAQPMSAPLTADTVSGYSQPEGARMWPTPGASPNQNRSTKPHPSHLNGTHGWNLGSAAADSLSPTPARMWPTPTASEGSKIPAQANYGQVGLNDHPRIRGEPTRARGAKSRLGANGGGSIPPTFPTPTTRDHKGGYNTAALTRKDGGDRSLAALPNAVLGGRGNETANGAQLNPTWVEWLMGYPLGWTVCAAWATRSSRRARSRSSSASQKSKGAEHDPD